MKVSLNWVRQFTDVPLGIDELVSKIGSQLGAVEEVVDYGAQYKDILVAEIAEKKAHPHADKLAIYQADAGGQEKMQVVSGDINIKVGDKVAWIRPGATVPSTYGKEPFVMESRELRGEISHGMFGSGSELGINEDKDKVLILDTTAAPGTTFAEAYELDDYVIDIENKMFTHRPDCFGILGVAREIAGIQHMQFNSPEWYLRTLDELAKGNKRLPLEVTNEIPELVPRFMMVALADITVHPSPLIMQSYLNRLGIRPINNVVDTTNYLMMLTGQPLHAFDYDKVKAQDNSADTATIKVRKPLENEKITLINGKTVQPGPEAIMIVTDSTSIGIGGIMGGAETEVTAETKNIILECANFDMYSVRKTSMEHGLFTEAVTRFNKGQSPWQNDKIIAEAVAMIGSLSGGKVAGPVYDLKQNISPPQTVEVSRDFINTRLGTEDELEEMATLLGNVELDVVIVGDKMQITPPFWRTDIHISEDVVEEVGRLKGYDQLPLDLPKRNLKPAVRNDQIDFAVYLRDRLSSFGANEVLTYSFVRGSLIERLGLSVENAYKLTNALSPELEYYRTALLPSLLEKVHPNLKSALQTVIDNNEFALFEINKVHIKGYNEPDEKAVPAEFRRLSLVFAADDQTAKKKYEGAAYYAVAEYWRRLAEAAGIGFELKELAVVEDSPFNHMVALFAPGRAGAVTIQGKLAGLIGEFSPTARRQLKLPSFCAGMELDVDLLQQAARPAAYQPLGKFPHTVQDMTLQLPLALHYNEVEMAVATSINQVTDKAMKVSFELYDIYMPKSGESKNLSFRFWVAHPEKTLTASEVNELLEAIASGLNQKLGARRV